MKDNLPRYTLRVSRILLDKLQHVAQYDGRSVNKEIEYLIKMHIAKFEKHHGRINLTVKKPENEKTPPLDTI